MWIVLGEEKGRVKLVSKSTTDAILPKGSFITIDDNENKYILRVDDSVQTEPYSPSPMLADMDLSPLIQDQKCQNIIYAYRIHDISFRKDGMIDFIKPQLIARKSTQDEIDLALETLNDGPNVFLATIYSGKNQLLYEENGNPISIKLPLSMFFHQMLICGKTGSGKTVSTKYLAQYFVEEFPKKGAVLAINVKDVDFLKMDKETTTCNPDILSEWKSIGVKPHGIDNFTIYYPVNTEIDSKQNINMNNCIKVSLNVNEIEPEALSGILQGISDVGAQHLPDIFRYWKNKQIKKKEEILFSDFVKYFISKRDDNYEFDVLNVRGDEFPVKLPWATYENILRNLTRSMEFFDNPVAKTIDATDILVRGKMSVINVASRNGIQFGSIILRHLLRQIVDMKSSGNINIPILIIIDEVHRFYDNSSSKEALDELDTICRTGRSLEIGVIFSSQNPQDIPRGLTSVVNTKIFFKSDSNYVRDLGINVTAEEIQSLRKGFAIANIHDLSQVRVIKFPLAFSGVFETR